MNLPPREREALQLHANGHTYMAAARRMGVSVTTVQCYLARARWRLDARNSTHAVAIAWRQGQIR